MPIPKPHSSLSELQVYMQKICAERAWDQADDLEIFLLFSEEVGELAKAIRNRRSLFQEEAKAESKHELEEEFADVLAYLLDLSNRFGVNLDEAFLRKEKINAARNWD